LRAAGSSPREQRGRHRAVRRSTPRSGAGSRVRRRRARESSRPRSLCTTTRSKRQETPPKFELRGRPARQKIVSGEDRRRAQAQRASVELRRRSHWTWPTSAGRRRRNIPSGCSSPSSEPEPRPRNTRELTG
jgi:hypothetical protein